VCASKCASLLSRGVLCTSGCGNMSIAWRLITRTSQTATCVNCVSRGQLTSTEPSWYRPGNETTSVRTSYTHTHTRLTVLFLSGTTRVGRYQKGKTNLDFTEARDSEWQWHQLGLNQVCTLLHADNQASTPALIFYRPVALPFAQPTVLKYIFTVCSWIMPLISLCTYRAHTILSIRREN